MEALQANKTKQTNMKFTVSSSLLLKRLQLLSGVLNNNNPLPILDNFLFELNKGSLFIYACDLETTMTTKLEVESNSKGKIALPNKLLLDILKTFSEQPLTFSFEEKSHAVEISSDYGKYKLTGFDGEEYPSMPETKDMTTLSVSTSGLARAISKTIFATGADELRPVMSGVFCQLSKDNITFVATDAHKLVRYIRKDFSSSKEAAFILPRKPLNLLKTTLNEAGEMVDFSFNDKNASFDLGHTTLICRMIEGKYPNYQAVIPTDNPNRLTIEKGSLHSSVRRVSIFSNKSTHQVRFKIAGSELQISAEDIDYNNEAIERLGCTYSGEDLEIGFNARFLNEMLSNIDAQEINIEMSAPNRAGIITPTISDDNQEDLLMLVMPVMLNN
ncbi:MAG: hypothetical protein RL065_329 [Bacteroidota bacterium]|jgi:DNA polymerase III subunit beta